MYACWASSFLPTGTLWFLCGKPTRLGPKAKPRLPTKLPPHVRHGLELALVVAGKAQHQMAGAGVGIGFQPGGRPCSRARIRHLALASHMRRHAVVLLEIGVEPRIGAGR